MAKCQACGGLGSRNITVTHICQGNYRRSDGSYHLESEGSETTHSTRWGRCPDCGGTGEV